MSTLVVATRPLAASLLVASTFLLAGCGSSSSSTTTPPGPPPSAASVAPAVGPIAGGTAVVVSGTDFVAGATVTFGGVAATVGAVTATTINLTTPAHAAGAVDVVVRNPDGQTDTLAAAFTYEAPPAAVDATWVVPDDAAVLSGALVTAFGGGTLYLNAHTTANGAGELRGQLDNGGADIRLASLNAAQEGATVVSSAFGAGILQGDPATRRVSGFVVTSGLANVTNAHIHRAARTVPPTPGPVVLALVPAGAAKDLWVVADDAAPLSVDDYAAFVAGTLYYNVHTAAYTAGEIRGQLDKAGTIKLASLNGAQERPTPVTTTALGAGLLAVDEATGAVAGFVVTTGLTNVTNAHVHIAARDVGGGVAVAMSYGPSLTVVPDDAAVLTPTQLTAFQSDGLYFNVHTAANGGGEIRGQIDKTGDVRVAAMDGAQERPTPVTTTAVGAGIVAVDATSGEVSGFITTRGLVSPTNAHVHEGARGAAGGVRVNLVKP